MVDALGRLDDLRRAECRGAVEGYFSTSRMVADHLDLFASLAGRLTGDDHGRSPSVSSGDGTAPRAPRTTTPINSASFDEAPHEAGHRAQHPEGDQHADHADGHQDHAVGQRAGRRRPSSRHLWPWCLLVGPRRRDGTTIPDATFRAHGRGLAPGPSPGPPRPTRTCRGTAFCRAYAARGRRLALGAGRPGRRRQPPSPRPGGGRRLRPGRALPVQRPRRRPRPRRAAGTSPPSPTPSGTRCGTRASTSTTRCAARPRSSRRPATTCGWPSACSTAGWCGATPGWPSRCSGAARSSGARALGRPVAARPRRPDGRAPPGPRGRGLPARAGPQGEPRRVARRQRAAGRGRLRARCWPTTSTWPRSSPRAAVLTGRAGRAAPPRRT